MKIADTLSQRYPAMYRVGKLLYHTIFNLITTLCAWVFKKYWEHLW